MKKSEKEFNAIFRSVMTKGHEVADCAAASLWIVDYNKEELWTRAMSGNQKSHLAGRSFRTCTPPTPPTLCADEPSARVVCKYEHSPWRYLYL